MTLEAARHLCQEARVVLTSLRAGPPMVARGDLAQDLMDVRSLVKQTLTTTAAATATASNNTPTDNGTDNGTATGTAAAAPSSFEPDTPFPSSTPALTSPPPALDAGALARPFLAVVMDPRAAGPHTLVALRALYRLLEQGTLQVPRADSSGLSNGNREGDSDDDHNSNFPVSLEPLTKGILNCKFEQTDAGADEAVEMAIADLLALIVQLDRRALQTETLMDAFHTVFVTRNTFVHSPALCYHFEDVLTQMVKAVFEDLDSLRDASGRLVLDFLVQQLLHTPLVGGDDEASREAQMAHDANRVLCLRLTRTALRAGFDDHYWSNNDLINASGHINNTTPPPQDTNNKHSSNNNNNSNNNTGTDVRSLLQIIQDDLCLSLLMTGQAVWAYQDQNQKNAAPPGFISLEVLSEICSTLSTLWNSISLRKQLVSQFEAIFTGFYQRALVLLRKRDDPTDSLAFHANLYLDAGVEIILESLVDIMTLHDHRQTVAHGNGGSLETLFAYFDCNIKRSDVAVGLMVELCRCTGSNVDEEGDALVDTSFHGGGGGGGGGNDDGLITTPQNSSIGSNEASKLAESVNGTSSAPPSQAGNRDTFSSASVDIVTTVTTNNAYRPVPPHLRELCAESIIGGMKCLFQDDHPSDETRTERQGRQSILAGHVSPAPQSWSDLSRISSSHHMRNIKSKKRLMRRAAQLFNKKSREGIEFLASAGVIEDPVTPRAVASFLRNALVVGLDKRAVGAYLGEVGKSAEAGKSPPVWQRDWFHKEVLETYCNLFRFERQSLLDGLRMFLAAFRLPGEAQQIDRILQAFSDSCSRVCEEGTQEIFSEDPKRGSDAAYLLSFSIIMLNTDQHNDNIREDRKMSKSDFVKNNTDYGRDITDKGKELPKEYLEAIYDGIREEEIRTEGEGADGSMTVERWKDVLRGSAEEDAHADDLPSVHDAEDLTELVLEHLWMPIMSSISALWGVKLGSEPEISNPGDIGNAGMLGAQGARLGMDMAWDMLVGVRQLGRNDIFCKIFNCICKYSGLLNFTSSAASRSWAFTHSVESQSAFVVALRAAREASDEIGIDGWKRICLMLFELRDLKMLGGGISSRGRSILIESEQDLLKEGGRREWTTKLLKRGLDADSQGKKSSGVSSMFGAMGRALFGSVDSVANEDPSERRQIAQVIRTIHGKEEHIIWDELAFSDDEDETTSKLDDADGPYSIHGESQVSLGAQFETLLIQEDLLLNQQREMPVTGLERVDDSQGVGLSPRARVRKRLSMSCDYAGLVSESRFMDDESIRNVIEALIALVPVDPVFGRNESSSSLDNEQSSSSFSAKMSKFPISPASEAFAEIVIAEMALRNRDRLTSLWHNHLKAHYQARLRNIFQSYTQDEKTQLSIATGSMEKCITGLLRISCCAVQRGEICNDILDTWTLLDDVEEGDDKKSLANSFDRHLGEGLWRITRGIDDSSELQEDGWNGLLSLTNWCVNRGYTLPPVKAASIGRTVGLGDDDPALQAYRSLHFMINVSEAKDNVPARTVKSIRTLTLTGEARNCPKLSVASLDLLHALCSIVESEAVSFYREASSDDEKSQYWRRNWIPILESMAEACHASSISSVRQHSLSMMTDSFLENQGGLIPVNHLCEALGQICIPLAGRRITELKDDEASADDLDAGMIELDLCIGLIFKPLRHHIQNVVNNGNAALLSIWSPILDVLKQILTSKNVEGGSPKVAQSCIDLTLEHLRNVVMVLISYGVLQVEAQEADDITAFTWAALSDIECTKKLVDEWKQAAASQ